MSANVSENSFFYFSSFENGGHSMVSSDDNIHMVTESVFLSSFPYVAHSSVNFFDCLTVLRRVGPVLLASFIWVAKIQSDKV